MIAKLRTPRNTPHPRFDRWSLRYKGFELARIECLGFFKLTNNTREELAVELCPLNAHAEKRLAEMIANDVQS